MVRCQRDREASRYDKECINAREAVSSIQAEEEEARRVDLEARSERKRQALRRTRQAAGEARRRAEEAERLRQEAEYLAQFGVLPPRDDLASDEDSLPEGNLPIAVVPEADTQYEVGSAYGDVVAPTDGGNAPIAIEEEPDHPGDEDNN